MGSRSGGAGGMSMEELRRALRAADPSAVLVPPRVLRRVIKHDRKMASLGLQVQNAMSAMKTRPWLFYPPGIMILIIALTINFIGDGLRDALDPRQTMVRR